MGPNIGLATLDTDGWVQDITHRLAVPTDIGGKILPRIAVIHYSGSGTAESAISWLTRRDDIYVSAHFVIARNGTITQIVPIFRKAYHAGRSVWKTVENVNNRSIGIELANWGRLLSAESHGISQGPFGCYSYTGQHVPDVDVVWATHKHEQVITPWEKYTDAQLHVCAWLISSIRATVPTLGEIVGHDDVAPGRKSDPGPAFDMHWLRVAVFEPEKLPDIEKERAAKIKATT
jgi:N-acetylmuramoyl-L-alanine amidase